jgi:acylglycerol lipase
MINEFKKIKSDTKVELNCLVRESGHKKWLVCTHGIGEHLMRHEYIIKNLAQNFNICLYDLRGHGDSTGKVAYVDSFDEYYHDLEEVCSYLRKTFAMDEYYLFGHSMGALITAGFVQNYLSNKPHPTKIFLSAPPVTVNGPHGSFFSLRSFWS